MSDQDEQYEPYESEQNAPEQYDTADLPEIADDPIFPGEEEDADEPRQRVSARSVAIWGGRAVAGVIGLGVTAAVVLAAVFVTPPTWSVTPPLLVVEPEPAPQLLVCPGPLLRLADDTGQNADQATPIGATPVVRFTAVSGDLAESQLGASDAGTGGTRLAPHLAVVTPVNGEPPVVAGMQSSRITRAEGNIVGLATASCEQPTLRSWLIAGSTELGRTTILTISNPSNVEATVDLDLYGETGAIDAVGLDGIVVPPGGQRVVPVNGFSLGQNAPVISVESSGGNVAVFVQESIIRTLTPGGVDLIGQQSPSTELVIPGVVVAGEAALAPLNVSAVDADDTMPTVRLFAPGGVATTATVAFVPEGSTLAEALAQPLIEEVVPGDADLPTPEEPTPGFIEVDLAAGAVAEVPVPAVGPGEYAVVVTADEPVVGAVRASVIDGVVPEDGDTTGLSVDFAWYSPAEALGDLAAVATPDAPSVQLVVVNPSDTDRTVTLQGPNGGAELVVPAGGAVWTDVEPRREYSLLGMAGLHAAIVSTSPDPDGDGDAGIGMVAQSPLLPPTALAQPVNVHA